MPAQQVQHLGIPGQGPVEVIAPVVPGDSHPVVAHQPIGIRIHFQQVVGGGHIYGGKILFPFVLIIGLQGFLEMNQKVGCGPAHAGEQVDRLGTDACIRQAVDLLPATLSR